MARFKVLFVCTGNICRSPSAEGILRHKLRVEGLDNHVATDSAGTHSYHVGEPPTRTGLVLAAKRGYDYADLRARQVQARDFETFDLILAMDRGHYSILERMSSAAHQDKLAMFMDFSAGTLQGTEVPDPYYGGPADYDAMLDLIEQGTAGLLAHIRKTLDV